MGDEWVSVDLNGRQIHHRRRLSVPGAVDRFIDSHKAAASRLIEACPVLRAV